MTRFGARLAGVLAVVSMGAAAAETVETVRPSFDALTPPPAPDYADPSAWAVLPSHPGAAALAPGGQTSGGRRSAPRVDVFYIHPTTYRGAAWNQRIDDSETNAWTDISVIARQASAFNACCLIYAPRYRQAATGALASTDGSGDKAYALAYQDVKTAFDYYLAHFNHGRPFILAGHSQGALMIYWLLEREIDGTPLKDRMVAAYAIGVAASQGDFGRTYKTIPVCAAPDSTGCVVTWNSFAEGADPSAYIVRSQARYLKRYGDPSGKSLVCVNPLTFDLTRPGAPASANLGALVGEPAPGPLAPLKINAVGAACQDGVLRVQASPDPTFKPTTLSGGVLHMHDIDLFYGNLRANAVLRTKAFLAAHLAGDFRHPKTR